VIGTLNSARAIQAHNVEESDSLFGEDAELQLLLTLVVQTNKSSLVTFLLRMNQHVYAIFIGSMKPQELSPRRFAWNKSLDF